MLFRKYKYKKKLTSLMPLFKTEGAFDENHNDFFLFILKNANGVEFDDPEAIYSLFSDVSSEHNLRLVTLSVLYYFQLVRKAGQCLDPETYFRLSLLLQYFNEVEIIENEIEPPYSTLNMPWLMTTGPSIILHEHFRVLINYDNKYAINRLITWVLSKPRLFAFQFLGFIFDDYLDSNVVSSKTARDFLDYMFNSSSVSADLIDSNDTDSIELLTHTAINTIRHVIEKSTVTAQEIESIANKKEFNSLNFINHDTFWAELLKEIGIRKYK